MKYCPNCNAQLDDDAVFCTACGTNVSGAQPNQQQQPNQGYGAPNQNVRPMIDPSDHTAEFDTKDISSNKVFAMVVYLLGAIGVIIALLASHDSPYVQFHLRQGLKIVVCEILVLICMAVLAITIIVPFVGAILLAILAVIKIISFFQVCSGKAKEPAIISSLSFLK